MDSVQPLEGSSDVLVVGAGPAGTAAAIVMARAGVRVRVIDRARFPRPKTCGDALSNGAVQLLDELGARAIVLARPHTEVTLARAVFVDGAVSRPYTPPALIIPRVDLDDALRECAIEAGATVSEGVDAREFVQDAAGRVVGVRGPGFRWDASVVIVATGHSRLAREALDLPAPRGRTLGVAITAYMRGVRYPDAVAASDHYLEPELRYGYGWVFPAVEGASNVGVYFRSDHFDATRQRLADEFHAFVARHPERFDGATLDGPTRTWPLPLGPTKQPHHGPGVFVAGDAGGFVDPLSGEGILQALATGRAAGEAAIGTLRGGDPTTIARTYEEECQRTCERPHRNKARVQAALDFMVQRRLFRVGPVRSALQWAYRRKVGERAGFH